MLGMFLIPNQFSHFLNQLSSCSIYSCLFVKDLKYLPTLNYLMLVLMKNQERLVLIFNESQDKSKTGILKNLGLKPGQTARIWGSDGIIKDPSSMTVTVLPQDVTVIHIK